MMSLCQGVAHASIHKSTAVDISAISAFQGEREQLMFPPNKFKVDEIIDMSQQDALTGDLAHVEVQRVRERLNLSEPITMRQIVLLSHLSA
eukprot:m.133079 g.133079  ORF g.133079 m.133079 type:complete len:91 (+) comp9499_c0_seq1:118-390(+)